MVVRIECRLHPQIRQIALILPSPPLQRYMRKLLNLQRALKREPLEVSNLFAQDEQYPKQDKMEAAERLADF